MENPQQFQYMMLGRLKSDCEYFLGYGNGSIKHLCYNSIIEHMVEMKKLWNVLKIKPEWLSFNDIIEYENKMLNYV